MPGSCRSCEASCAVGSMNEPAQLPVEPAADARQDPASQSVQKTQDEERHHDHHRQRKQGVDVACRENPVVELHHVDRHREHQQVQERAEYADPRPHPPARGHGPLQLVRSLCLHASPCLAPAPVGRAGHLPGPHHTGSGPRRGQPAPGRTAGVSRASVRWPPPPATGRAMAPASIRRSGPPRCAGHILELGGHRGDGRLALFLAKDSLGIHFQHLGIKRTFSVALRASPDADDGGFDNGPGVMIPKLRGIIHRRYHITSVP